MKETDKFFTLQKLYSNIKIEVQFLKNYPYLSRRSRIAKWMKDDLNLSLMKNWTWKDNHGRLIKYRVEVAVHLPRKTKIDQVFGGGRNRDGRVGN